MAQWCALQISPALILYGLSCENRLEFSKKKYPGYLLEIGYAGFVDALIYYP